MGRICRTWKNLFHVIVSSCDTNIKQEIAKHCFLLKGTKEKPCRNWQELVQVEDYDTVYCFLCTCHHLLKQFLLTICITCESYIYVKLSSHLLVVKWESGSIHARKSLHLCYIKNSSYHQEHVFHLMPVHFLWTLDGLNQTPAIFPWQLLKHRLHADLFFFYHWSSNF